MASVFSGKAGRNSAIWTAQQGMAQLGELNSIYGAGRSQADQYITQGYDQSMADLEKYYPQSRDDLTQSLDKSQGYITQGRDAALGNVNQGYGSGHRRGRQILRPGRGSAEPQRRGLPAADRQVDDRLRHVHELDGAQREGGQRSRDRAFQAGPGYQWQVDQAQQGASRQANKIGGAYGGNAQDTAVKLSSNLANQEYGNWQNQAPGLPGRGAERRRRAGRGADEPRDAEAEPGQHDEPALRQPGQGPRLDQHERGDGPVAEPDGDRPGARRLSPRTRARTSRRSTPATASRWRTTRSASCRTPQARTRTFTRPSSRPVSRA